MKKIIIIIFVFAIFLVGCDIKEKNKKTYIVDYVNDGVLTSVEKCIWTDCYFNNSNAVTYFTFNFMGKSYNAKYQKSINDKLNSYITDIYKTEDGIKFGLRSGTSQMVMLNLMNKNFYTNEPIKDDNIKTNNEAIDFATTIAKNYIDIIDYEIFPEDEDVIKYEIDGKEFSLFLYTITFARKINGYLTSDYISIKITSKGNIASIKMGDIGVFNDRYSNILMKQKDIILKNISSTIEFSYTEKGYTFENNNVYFQRVVVTPDGELCLYSRANVEIINLEGEKISTAIGVLTYIE